MLNRTERRRLVRLLSNASNDELADVQQWIEEQLRQAKYDCGLFRNGKEYRTKELQHG